MMRDQAVFVVLGLMVEYAVFAASPVRTQSISRKASSQETKPGRLVRKLIMSGMVNADGNIDMSDGETVRSVRKQMYAAGNIRASDARGAGRVRGDLISTKGSSDGNINVFDAKLANLVRKQMMLGNVGADGKIVISHAEPARSLRQQTSAAGFLSISDAKEGSPVRKQILSGKVGSDGTIDLSDAKPSSLVRKHMMSVKGVADGKIDISYTDSDVKFPSLMQASHRKQYTWASSVVLPVGMLLVVLTFTVVLTGAIVRLVDAFDLEIPDDQLGGARLYKWVFEAPDPDVCTAAVGGTHVFLDYHHIDLDLTEEAIKKLLASHGCLQNVEPYIPDFLWDCIRQSSRFMISKDKRNILLIRDFVMVRFSCCSHLLVERVEKSGEEKAYYSMPTLDKIGAESPHKAAERWCTRNFDFLLKQVRFIEADTETHFINKYEGLRLVERKFVVIVQLIQDNPQMPEIPRNQESQELLWMPLSEIESHPHIPKHIALAEVNLWVGGKLHEEADLVELEDFLKSNGVDTRGWTGTDGTKTSESLLTEINNGQCILKLEGETVDRIINLTALRLRSVSEDGILLVEVGRRESGGAIKWNMNMPGVKQKVGESIEAAARRTCKKILRLGEDDFDIYPETSRECIKYASPSKTYPGIMTAYYMYLVNVDLCDEAPLAPKWNSCLTWNFRKLERVSPRKIGTLWGE